MARIPEALLATAMVALAGSSALAEPVKQLSHRDRLYDVAAAHGGELYAVGHPGVLLRSNDGGTTFEKVRAGQTDQALFSVAFNAKGQGAVVGRAGFFLTTLDHGASWRQGVVKLGEEHPSLFSVAVLPDGTIVAAGEFGAIVRSEDHGKTWTRSPYTVELETPKKGRPADSSCQTTGSSESENSDVVQEARLTDLVFLDSTHGLIVGEFGLVLRSEDGGRTFQRRASCTDLMLYSVATAGRHAIAVGAEGSLIESNDGGLTWARRNSGTSEHLFGVFEADRRALVLGAGGTALLREDSGGFKPIDSGVHGWLTAAVLDRKGQGVVVGSRGYVRRTDDGGNTLQRVLGE